MECLLSYPNDLIEAIFSAPPLTLELRPGWSDAIGPAPGGTPASSGCSDGLGAEQPHRTKAKPALIPTSPIPRAPAPATEPLGWNIETSGKGLGSRLSFDEQACLGGMLAHCLGHVTCAKPPCPARPAPLYG